MRREERRGEGGERQGGKGEGGEKWEGEGGGGGHSTPTHLSLKAGIEVDKEGVSDGIHCLKDPFLRHEAVHLISGYDVTFLQHFHCHKVSGLSVLSHQYL